MSQAIILWAGFILMKKTCSGKSPDSLLEDGCGGQTSGSRGCGGQPKHPQHRQIEHNQIQPGNVLQSKSVKSQSEGDQHILDQTRRGNGDATNRLALLQTRTNFEGQLDQESFGQGYQNQPIQVEQVNKFSKGRHSLQDQQSKGECYRDTSSGQSSMDTYDAQTSEEARPSTTQQRGSSPKEWFSKESEGLGKSSPIDDTCLKPAAVVSKESRAEKSPLRKATEERAYWYTPATPIQSSGALDFPPSSLLGEVDTTRKCSSNQPGGKEQRKEDDLQPDAAGFCIGDIGLRSVGDEKTGTLRPKKRKKGKSELGSGKGSREKIKHCNTDLTKNRSENRTQMDSTGDQKENQNGSKTGTLRPKKGRLKVLAAGPSEEDARKRGGGSSVITGDVLGERINKISLLSKSTEMVNEVDSEVSNTNTLRQQKSPLEVSVEGMKEAEKETNPELDWLKSPALEENNDVLKISMDWRKENILNEGNFKVSDMSILKPKTESGQDKNRAIHENNLPENAETCSGEGITILKSPRDSEEKSLAHNCAKQTDSVKAVTADEEDIKTYNTDVKTDDTDVKASAASSMAMDTLLSISEVNHVWPWFSVFVMITESDTKIQQNL